MANRLAEDFEILEHTADVGFRAWAPTLPDLFAQCARALIAVMVDIDSVAVKDYQGVEVAGADVEELLYNWLSEILYWFDGEGLVTCEFNVVSHKTVDGMEFLQAEIGGEKFDRERHLVKTYVKAITYHQMQVKHTDEGYTATVYLDI